MTAKEAREMLGKAAGLLELVRREAYGGADGESVNGFAKAMAADALKDAVEATVSATRHLSFLAESEKLG